MANVERPLSPHLQIYRPQITSVLSILHRMTGVVLGIGTLLLAWWLIALATGPESYATAAGFLGSWFGQLVLLGFTWALFYHLCNGIRHLVWDTGRGFELETAAKSGMAVLICSVALTVIAFGLAYTVGS
ncbi:succinate dehydrogenase, cytochrome b556 subunit [Oceanibacterium hippocampi]|uniref:Succinate dehydrogenase cytochrome b556 subunit n=1 Tax=Oceanibacterium hippocampi TaxID=745714 RepID=A0A1Y5RC66_9PROT|nr:succinate dehydrogenase, cytochrome b556 subunit [Oceanibacterium hippocampi]SLN14062.1 Succinate dehydrogenase cytochrome b556 subunit [Oceanibacterium hippocampi]